MLPRYMRKKSKYPYAVAMGRRGAAARNRNMTPEQRSAAARHAVGARWAMKKMLAP